MINIRSLRLIVLTSFMLCSWFAYSAPTYTLEITLVNGSCTSPGGNLSATGEFTVDDISRTFNGEGQNSVVFSHDFASRPTGNATFSGILFCGFRSPPWCTDFNESWTIDFDDAAVCSVQTKTFHCNRSGEVSQNITFSAKWTISEIDPQLTSPKLGSDVNTQFCGDEEVTIEINNQSDLYKSVIWNWSIDSSSWSSIPGSLNDQSITFSLEDLVGANKIPYYDTTFYILATVGNCTNSEVRASQIFRFFPAPPTIENIEGIPPNCPDGLGHENGEGSILIEHGPDTPLGVEFIYTVTQYVRKTGPDCLVIGGEDQTLDISNANFCGGFTDNPNGITGEYCTGLKGNYTNTFTNSSELSFTLEAGESIEEVNSEGDPTGNYLNLYPGVYEIEVESSAGSGTPCFCRFFVEIPLSNYVDMNASPPTTTKAPSCQGDNDGELSVDLSNGYGNYNWSLSGGGLSRSGETTTINQSTGTIAGLPYGETYTLSVTDSCKTVPFTNISIDTPGPPIVTTSTKTNIQCRTSVPDGKVRATATNIAGRDYKFTLFSSGGSQVRTETVESNVYEFTGLGASEFYVVTEVDGCDASANSNTVEVEDVSTLEINARATSDASCSNSSNGIITITPTKTIGNISFSFELHSATGTLISEGIRSSEFTIRDLPGGEYTLEITDLCNNNASESHSVNVPAPLPVEFYPVDNISLACYNDRTNVQLYWNTGGGDYNSGDFIITGTRRLTSGGYSTFLSTRTVSGTTYPLNNLSPLNGYYEVVIRDACGERDTVEFSVTSPSELIVSNPQLVRKQLISGGSTLSNTTCHDSFDGEVTFTVQGGVQDSSGPYYNISVSQGDDTNFLVVDESRSGDIVSYTIGGLKGEDPYILSITDFNSDPNACSVQTTEFELRSPQEIEIVSESYSNANVFADDGLRYILCNGNTDLEVLYSGGYSCHSSNLLFFNDAIGDFENYSDFNPFYSKSINGRTLQFRNLEEGTYKYEFTDRLGCTFESPEFELHYSNLPLEINYDSVSMYVHGFNTKCQGDVSGEIYVNYKGGVGDYQIWIEGFEDIEDNSPYSNTPAVPANHTDSPQKRDIGNLSSRVNHRTMFYKGFIQDDVGCEVSFEGANEFISLTEPRTVRPVTNFTSIDGLEVFCKGESAQVEISSSGNTYPAWISLNGGSTFKVTGPTDSEIFYLTEGDYSITSEDTAQCIGSLMLSIDEPETEIVIDNISATPPVCLGDSSGVIQVTAIDGSPYDNAGNDFYWYMIRKLGTGNLEYDADSIYANSATFIRPAGEDGLSNATYEVLVKDRYGCSVIQNIVMTPNPNPLTLVVNTSQPPNCNSGTDGYISVTASNFDEIGGTDLIFSITGGHFTDTLNVTRNVIVNGPTWTFEDLHDTNDYPSAYNLWVTDDYGCPVNIAYDLYEDNIKLPAPDTLNISLDESIRPSCFNGIDGNITLLASGGVGSYRFIFDEDTTSIASNVFFQDSLEAGNYAFSLIDAHYQADQPTCLYRDSFEIHPGRIVDLITDVTNVTCFQGNDGNIDLSVDILNRPAAESVDPDSLFLFWINDLSGDTLSTKEDLFGIEAASYTVKARYNMDSAICLNEERIVVRDPDLPFTISSLTVYNSQCGTSNSGRIILSITGGYASVQSEYRLNSDPWIQFDGASVLINNLDIGDYLLEVRPVGTDCPDIGEFSIAEGMLSLGIDEIKTPSCNGNNDGEVHLTFDEPGLEFALVGNSFLANNGVFTGLSAGDYKFVARKIADAGCESDTLNVTISEPAQLLVSLDGITMADCDQPNGTASASANGGTGIYSFSWKDISGVNADPQNLTPGDYTVTVTDENGCSDTTPFTIDNNPNLSLSYTIMDTADCDYPNGSATLIITDGVAPFDLNGIAGLTETSILLESMMAGDTLITVSDERGCSNDIVITVPTQNTLSAVLDAMIQTTCGDTNGSLSVSVSGGTPPYSYTWDGFDATTNTLTDLSIGSYDLTVSDVHGCTFTDTYDVTPADGISSVSFWISDPFCEQQTGSITITNVSGDFPPYHVNLVFDGSTSNTGTYDPSGSELIIPDLGAGNYALEVIDDNGCLFPVGGIILTDDPNYIPTVVANLIDSSACGLAVGEASVTVSGGQSPYSFSWVDADEIDLGITSEVASELAQGEYTNTVIDDLGCFNNDEIIIVDQDAPLIQLINTTPSPLGANNGSATVQAANGGGAPFTYSLDGEGVNMVNTTGNFTELPPGTFHAFANDVFGCVTNTINFDISATAGLEVRILSITDATCQSASDAVAQAGVSGGISPYSFFWDETLGTETQSELSVGDHWVIVEDAIGSLDSLFYSIDYLTPISMEVFTSKASCPGTCDGSIDLLVSNGSGSYNVVWEHGATGVSLDDLCPGSYIYTITDAANDECTYSGEVVIEQYEGLSVSQIESEAPTCYDGTNGYVSVNVSGGSGSYAYSWENGDTDNRLNAVTPGAYTLTISDNILGCSITSSFEIPQIPAIDLSEIAVTPPSCSGGDNGVIVIALANASSPKITWNNGQIGTRATGLSAGTYQFEVLDAKGCTFSGEVEMEERTELVVNVDTSNPLCFGDCTGTIDLEISGGAAPYFVAWLHGPRNLTLGGLCAGSYPYTVTDKFGCEVSGSIDITSPEELEVSLDQFIKPSCNGDDDGSISVNVSGGIADYEYEWSNGAFSAVNSNINAGNYTLLVTDKNECSANFNYNLQEPPALLINDATIMDPSCPQTEDGQITVSAIGGTSPYTFSWNDGVNSQNRTGLVEGNYIVTIRDDQGCEYARSFRLRSPNGLEIVNIKENDPQCFGDENGSITLEVYGGTNPYTFLWDNGSISQNLTNIGENTYDLTVSDANDCDLSQKFEIENPPKPKVAGLPESTLVCTGGTAILEPENDWKLYDWKGSNGFSAISKRIEVTEEGDYTLIATDANDCPSEPYTTVVEVGDNILDADILRLSEAIVFEPIVFVDISLPVPENIEWVIPDDPNIIINIESQANVELVFLETGNYEIGLRANIGTCESEIFKNIVVKEWTEGARSTNGRITPKVQVDIFPNPANEIVSFKVRADSREMVDLIMLSNLDHRTIIHEKLEGSYDYLIKLDISQLESGVYLIYITQGNLLSSKLFVVK